MKRGAPFILAVAFWAALFYFAGWKMTLAVALACIGIFAAVTSYDGDVADELIELEEDEAIDYDLASGEHMRFRERRREAA